MPDYRIDENEMGKPRVEVMIPGQVLDIKYTQLLMKRSDLELRQVLLLDSVQKKRALPAEDIRALRKLKLIEGRVPNLYVSAKVAEWAGQKANYIRNKGLDDGYYRELVVDYLKKYVRPLDENSTNCFCRSFLMFWTPRKRLTKYET